MRLDRSFYAQPTLTVLDALVGMVLVHECRGRRTAGIIVEAEAYIGEDDPACHAAPGPTKRNAPLYGAPGHAYVYLNYGLHYLVNAVTEGPGRPAAILIRALEPVEGLAIMRRRRLRGRATGARRPIPDHHLCRGPGNLTMAMGIDFRQNEWDLTGDALWIEDRRLTPGRRVYSPRIGISVGTERAWRCAIASHPSVSGPRIRKP